MFNKFLNYLNETLPRGYYPEKEKDRITIRNKGTYVYMFYRQEIEEDYELCCSLINTIISVTR